jgi:acetyl esterase
MDESAGEPRLSRTKREREIDMSTLHMVDPEVLPIITLLPASDFTRETIPAIRQMMAEQFVPDFVPAMTPQIVTTSGRDGAPDVQLYIYNPQSARRNRPAILHIHGGGMVIGTAAMSIMSMPPIALELDVVVVSVDYRLAPETPFPGPQEDCYAGLEWLVAHAADLDVDPARIIIMGESAGGGLAAAVSHMARDRGQYRLAAQILTYPMLDHRTGGPDCPWRNPMTGEFVWTPARNQFGWESLRGDYGVDDHRAGWFSPARAHDLAGLPPAYVSVGALDLFLDEDLDYTRRLAAAGVPVETHVYPGAIHAFNLVAEAAVAKQANADLMAALGRLMKD